MIDSDLSLISLTLEQNVVVYQQSNGTIALIIVGTYQKGAPRYENRLIKSAPTDISFHRFSAIKPDTSPLIYIYYQLNESTIAEISYNTTSERWAFDSMGISIL